MRYLIKFSYDGTAYSGYQKQKGLDTIEKRLEFCKKIINMNLEGKIYFLQMKLR